MRVFVAIDLPDHVRDEVEALQQTLTVGRLVPPENLHLTLCFLGEQPVDALEEAHEALSSIRLPEFDLQLAGIGTFGTHSPKVVFAEVMRSEPLIELERHVNRRLRAANLDFQKQRFRPHVTIARLAKVLPGFELGRLGDYLAEHAAFRSSRFRVKGFAMFRSTLLPGAARHEILASYDLPAA